MALLYVVGTTTFLLARELTRPAPASAPKTDGASAADLAALSRKIDELDNQARANFADLKGNDGRQRDDLANLSGSVNNLKQEETRTEEKMRARIEELQDNN